MIFWIKNFIARIGVGVDLSHMLRRAGFHAFDKVYKLTCFLSFFSLWIRRVVGQIFLPT